VNPEISSGLPLPSINRMPPPGSRPERYATPATRASDPAQNPYWKRDVRRQYAQLSVVTQNELAGFLLQEPPPAPSETPKVEDKASVPAEVATAPPTPALHEAIATLHSKGKGPSFATPPTPPSSFPRWKPQTSPNAPHDPHAYWPMILVK